MNVLHKIQNLPESKRKIILWIVVIVIGLLLFTWWIRNSQIKLKSFEIKKFKEELKIPSFGEELKNLPGLEIPQ